MPKIKNCDHCGRSYSVQRLRRPGYCSESCKKQAKRRREDPGTGGPERKKRRWAQRAESQPRPTLNVLRVHNGVTYLAPPSDKEIRGLRVDAKSQRRMRAERTPRSPERRTYLTEGQVYARLIEGGSVEQTYIPIEEWPKGWIESERRQLRRLRFALRVLELAEQFGLTGEDLTCIRGAERVARGETYEPHPGLAEYLERYEKTADFRRRTMQARSMLIAAIREVDMTLQLEAILEQTIAERIRAESAATKAEEAQAEVERIRTQAERTTVERFIEDALSR